MLGYLCVSYLTMLSQSLKRWLIVVQYMLFSIPVQKKTQKLAIFGFDFLSLSLSFLFRSFSFALEFSPIPLQFMLTTFTTASVCVGWKTPPTPPPSHSKENALPMLYIALDQFQSVSVEFFCQRNLCVCVCCALTPNTHKSFMHLLYKIVYII